MSQRLCNLPETAAVLVQGASSGIGLAFTRRLLEDVPDARVFATSRDPSSAEELMSLAIKYRERLHCLAMDVTDEASIEAAAQRVGDTVKRLDLLINCAGVLHDLDGLAPEKRLEDVTPRNLERSFRVNAFGPLLVAKHFLRLLNHDRRAVFASISARIGSIEDNRLGGWYAYRASKAAQNQFTRTLAIECGRRAKNLIVIAFHPGTTDTRLSKPFQANVPPEQLASADETTRSLCETIASLGPEDSGEFRNWRGEPLPW